MDTFFMMLFYDVATAESTLEDTQNRRHTTINPTVTTNEQPDIKHLSNQTNELD